MLDEFELIMTVQEVATVLGCGRNRIYELIGSNKIKGYRVGKVWKVPKAALLEYIYTEAKLDTNHFK